MNLMALEIERRFLVTGKEWEPIANNPQHFRQAYLIAVNEGWTVRVRIHEKEKAWLTLKSRAGDNSNNEFEYQIPLEDAESLWELAPHKLTKTRFTLNLEGGDWIVDCFEEGNAPLVIAEVELSTQGQKISKPTWCSQEITNNKKLSNAALAQRPICEWPAESLLSINII